MFRTQVIELCNIAPVVVAELLEAAAGQSKSFTGYTCAYSMSAAGITTPVSSYAGRES